MKSIFGKIFVNMFNFKKITKIITLLILCSLLLPAFEVQANEPKSNVRIIVYHTFMGDKNTYSFSQEEMKKQLEELIADGYKFISHDDFTKGNYSGNMNILLTIDDGHTTVYEAYKKVLVPLGIKPLLAIYPAIIGKKKFALTWEQLEEMLKDGCALASHGFYHNFVTESALKKDKKSVETEIIRSKKVLEEKTGRTVDTFVYPFGAYSKTTIDALKKAGYSYAMTIKMGHARVVPENESNYELPRYLLTRQRITRISGLFKDKKVKQVPTAIALNTTTEKEVKAEKQSFERVSEKGKSLALFDNPPAIKQSKVKKDSVIAKTNAAYIEEDDGVDSIIMTSKDVKVDERNSDMKSSWSVSAPKLIVTEKGGIKEKIYSMMAMVSIARDSFLSIINKHVIIITNNIKDFLKKLS